MLLGQLGGAFVVACVQSVVYLLVGLATGVGFASGVGGVLVLLALSLADRVRLRQPRRAARAAPRQRRSVQGIFPLLFVTLFLSSSSLPRNLIKTNWFREVATYNPVSYLIEGMRSLIIKGWNAQALELAFGFAIALAADLARARRGPR